MLSPLFRLIFLRIVALVILIVVLLGALLFQVGRERLVILVVIALCASEERGRRRRRRWRRRRGRGHECLLRIIELLKVRLLLPLRRAQAPVPVRLAVPVHRGALRLRAATL